jgi:hypothetical protein
MAGVDKVYGPLVEQGEKEIEVRGTFVKDDDAARDGKRKEKYGLGYGVLEHVFVEGYLIFEDQPSEHYKLEAYELETKFQLSEQGQYFVDLGLLAELEKVHDVDLWEFKIGPILQKQFNAWVGTLNLFAERKFGRDNEKNEFELLGAAQVRYRLKPTLEPAFEYYYDENTQTIGPALIGSFTMGNHKTQWEAGVQLGLDDDTPDVTFRWLVEYEF